MGGAIEPEGQEVPGPESAPEGLDMVSQEGAYTTGVEGQTPYGGSDMANPNALI